MAPCFKLEKKYGTVKVVTDRAVCNKLEILEFVAEICCEIFELTDLMDFIPDTFGNGHVLCYIAAVLIEVLISDTCKKS